MFSYSKIRLSPATRNGASTTASLSFTMPYGHPLHIDHAVIGLGPQATTSPHLVPHAMTVAAALGSINVHTIYPLVWDEILTQA